MLRLSWETPAGWARHAAAEPLALLSDHAHCEMKAAASAQALIAKNFGRRELVGRLGDVAREEMEHFVRVIELLHARGGSLGPPVANPYAEGLLAAAAQGRESALLDRLVVSALIEARSLERFTCLARELAEVEPELAELYRSLLRSEAAHRALFLELAGAAFPAETVARRVAELAAREGRLIAGLEPGPRVHSGPT